MAERVRIFRPDDPERSAEILTDLSEQINLYIFDLAADDKMIYRDPWPGGTTRQNILRVRERKEKKFRRIVDKFPHRWQVTEQGAYILRAFSGLQLFPDANHRTGLALSRLHLAFFSYRLEATPDQWRALVKDLKSQQGPYRSVCKVDAIGDRNACFNHVAEFYGTHTRVPTLFGRAVELLKGRQLPPEHMAFLESESAEDEAARKKLLASEMDEAIGPG